jgi:hypothetical protein
MNCEKGDIARVVGLPYPVSEVNDRLVRLSELIVFEGVPYWRFEQAVKFRARSTFSYFDSTFMEGEAMVLEGLNDAFLRPIRDPGDDAVDEMLLRVGVPEGLTA